MGWQEPVVARAPRSRCAATSGNERASEALAPQPLGAAILKSAMPATLDQIVAARRRSVAAAKAVADVRALERAAEEHVPRGFRAALAQASAGGGVAVIAELKKASPSRGVI